MAIIKGFQVPDLDVGSVDELGVQASIKLYLEDVLGTQSQKKAIPSNLFEKSINALLYSCFYSSANTKGYQNLVEWIHDTVTQQITDVGGLNIANTQANTKAARDRISGQVFLTVLVGLVVVLTVPLEFWFYKLTTCLISMLVSLVCLGMYFGSSPKYQRHIEAVSKAYGSLIYDALLNRPQSQLQANSYIDQKRIRQSRPIIYNG